MAASDPSRSTTAPQGTAIHASEPVYFALQSRVNYKNDKGYPAARNLVARVQATGLVLCAALIMTGLNCVAGVQFDSTVFVLCCLGALPFLLWSRISNRRFRRIYKDRLPLKPPERCRLCCIGAPEQLAEYGEWADVPFEPALFFGKFAVRGRGWPRWLYVGIVILVLSLWLTLGVHRLLGPSFAGQAYIAFSVALGAAEGVTALLWPTYLRLVPGRLDVLGYGPFSKKPIFLDRYDLRDATVLVDLRQSFVRIVGQHGQHRRAFGFYISLMSERRRFVYMLFLAAMSTFEPGPVPEDDLVG